MFAGANAKPELIATDGQRIVSETSDAALTINGLTVSYGSRPAVFSLDVEVPKGAMMAIVGPNGAGKSTLLKASLGIIPKVSGIVQVNGKPIAECRHDVAYVPQRASVDWDFPIRVIDVVYMGLYRETGLLGRLNPSLRKRALSALDRVGMVDFAQRQIGQLSGGQQQRVFLARALVQAADLYLLDEPFAGVDAATERAIITVLRDLKSEGRTVVAVHHDLATVTDYFDHVLMVNVRKMVDGPVFEAFTPEMLQATYGGRLASAHIDQLNLA